MKRRTTKALLTLASIAILMGMNGCSTGTEDGLCKPAKNTGMVAGTTDINGDAWTLAITPKDGYTQKCASSSESGTIRVFAVIKDSLGIPKAGLAINGSMGEVGSGLLSLSAADVNTDSCGSAMFDIAWKCPSNAGEQREGTLIVNSGALSNSVTVTVDHYVPPTGLVGESLDESSAE